MKQVYEFAELFNLTGTIVSHPWLNSLPKTQDLVKAKFSGQPVDESNLSEYRKFGFRKWQIQHAALEFSSHFDPSTPSAAAPAPPVEHFVHWISIRLAAIAKSATFADDPKNELRDIRNFLHHIIALSPQGRGSG